ncbi:RNA-directed DNA polymerase, eukaryota, Reverse transcriptase zinc-binding domain protein [Artemisia annua]|uniref:RNA-directed DNA polymerase, eukaryota, Reverse transcriptase zinc-binding domain protein n=1 Tax=Artemisia annua TaxID=35608 RepID=A0A2U1L2Q2_ARTAN|nr:RNA-directed DNA polymerase, eukaryota, Reverse transcriptase zinc-binding domain protein [Artemisia annua]
MTQLTYSYLIPYVNMILSPKQHHQLHLWNNSVWNSACKSAQITLIIRCSYVNDRGVQPDSNDSWGWKNILRIRDKIRRIMVYKIGDGKRTSLWYDNWSQVGPLINHVTHRNIYAARLADNMKVSEMVSNGNWNRPRGWYDLIPEITRLADPVLIPMKEVNFL